MIEKKLLSILMIFLILGSGISILTISQAQSSNSANSTDKQLMNTIKTIESIILRLQGLGLNMSKALKLIENAKESMTLRRYSEAKHYAIKALRVAGEIARDNLNYTPTQKSVNKAIEILKTIIMRIEKKKPSRAKEIMKHLDLSKDLFSKGRVAQAIKELRNINTELRKLHKELSENRRIHIAKCIAKRLESIIEIIKEKAEEKGINASELIHELRKEIEELKSKDKLTLTEIINVIRSVLASHELLDEVYSEIKVNAELIKEQMYRGLGIEKHVLRALNNIPKSYSHLIHLIPKRSGLIIEFLINMAKKIYVATMNSMDEDAKIRIKELINTTCKAAEITKLALEAYILGNGEKMRELALRSKELASTNVKIIKDVIANNTKTKAEYVILMLLKVANEVLIRIDNAIIRLSETLPSIEDKIIIKGIVLHVNNESKKALIWGMGKPEEIESGNISLVPRPRFGLWIINYSLVSEEIEDLKPGYVIHAYGEITKYERNIPVITVSEIEVLAKHRQ